MINQIPSPLRTGISFLGAVWVHLILFLALFIRIEILAPPQIQTEKMGTSELEIEIESPFESQAQESEKNEGDQNKGGMSDKDFAEMMGLDPSTWGDLLDRLSENKELRQTFPDKYDNINMGGNASQSYIYRKRHHEDLIVKEVFPTLDNLDLPFEQIVNKAPGDLMKHQKRNEIIGKYRDWTKGDLFEQRLQTRIVQHGVSDSKAPLHFPKEQREKYFDQVLKKPKEEQFADFAEKFLSYDPDKGDLPVAVRELYYDNLQRIAYKFSTDPSYFYLDYFEENLNKEDFLKNSLYQVKRLKGTKTMTELLFAIENIYEIQERAWNQYLDFGALYPNLSAEQKQSLRIETLRRIYQRYQPMAQELGMTDRQKVSQTYTKKRLEVLDYLIANTPKGYRKNDALFMRAIIHWEMGQKNNNMEEMNNAALEWYNLALENEITPQTPQVIMNPDDPNYKEEENPFLMKNSLIQLTPYLELYLYGTELDKARARGMINSVIYNREQYRMQDKIEREKKLLYP